jgi:hypothetical protein
MQITASGINNFPYIYQSNASRDALPRVAILSEWLRYFNDLAVGETAAPACFSRENAEGAGMPPSRQGGIIEITRHIDTRVKRGGAPCDAYGQSLFAPLPPEKYHKVFFRPIKVKP